MKLIELAKINNAWNFLDDVENLILPSELIQALQKFEKAEFYISRFPDSSI